MWTVLKFGLGLDLGFIFRSTVLSRPNKVGLCPSAIREYVRQSTTSFFDFNLAWGWWVMHDNIQYDPIQGQGEAISTIYNGSWQLPTDS